MFELNANNTIYYALDHGSNGIVAVHTNKFILDSLISGFMDVSYYIFYPWELMNLEEKVIGDLRLNWVDFKIGTEKNPVEYFDTTTSYYKFKEIKTLCQVRLPYHEYLHSLATFYYNRYDFGFIGSNIADAEHILQSEQLLNSYAKSLNTSPYMAEQELRHHVNMIKTTKANTLISYTYYVNKINNLNTKEELDPLMKEMHLGFKFGHNHE